MAHPGSRFAAGFFQQTNILDDHAAIDGLAHVVNGQQAGGNRGQRLHLDAGAADGFGGDFEVDALPFGMQREIGGDAGKCQRMA
jgi:hypothetical protein